MNFEIGGLYICLLILRDIENPDNLCISYKSLEMIAEFFPNCVFVGELNSIDSLKDFQKMEPFFVIGHDKSNQNIEILQTVDGESINGLIKYYSFIFDPLWKERHFMMRYKTAVYRLL